VKTTGTKPSLLEAFLQYLSTERKYSPHTQLAYKKDLTDFSVFIEKNFQLNLLNNSSDLEDLTQKMIRSWIVSFELKRSSALRKISAVRAYLNFCRRAGHLTHNPATDLVLPKQEKRLPVFVSQEQMVHLLDHFPWDNSFESVRDRAMIEMFYSCGLRREELIQLSYSNIHFGQKILKVFGKGKKERIVPFGQPLQEVMQGYISTCENLNLNYKGKNFFLTVEGNPIYPKLVYRVVNYYLSWLGNLSKASPHVLRHTFATHLLDNGADLNAVKELLGHTSLAATQVYVHNSIQKLKNVHKKAHPKAEKS